ncbi:MAG TPA: cytochrome C biogenesis protein ResC [Actinobacteria bacterium]|nr:cytochrome C biogenesis protein ResC [Actinomycetota bacterium]
MEVVTGGALWIAFLIAFAAGVVAFLSPCVLPLAPGYVSYITGLTGAELADGSGSRRRVLAGSVLFVLGFSVVFVSYGVLFGGIGSLLLQYADVINRILGVVVIIMGLGFLGLIPGLQREWRLHRAPAWGVAGAPLLGLLFGIGWSPCIGPTLTAVQTLAFTEASALRGAILSLAYCFGLGLPFILLALAFSRMARAIGWVREHYVWVMRLGGGMLVLVGLLLVTGVWSEFTVWLRVQMPGFETAL